VTKSIVRAHIGQEALPRLSVESAGVLASQFRERRGEFFVNQTRMTVERVERLGMSYLERNIGIFCAERRLDQASNGIDEVTRRDRPSVGPSGIFADLEGSMFFLVKLRLVTLPDCLGLGFVITEIVDFLYQNFLDL
jgi:hypothetical protein